MGLPQRILPPTTVTWPRYARWSIGIMFYVRFRLLRGVNLANRSNRVVVTEKTLRLETPLFLAASSGHRDVVSYLIQFAKSTLNTPDIDGNTPLQGAAHASHDRVVEDLVAAGADLHIRDNIGNTALHYACWVGCARAAQVLLSGGADPRVKNEDDSFPIHYAAQGTIPFSCFVLPSFIVRSQRDTWSV